MNTNIKAFFTNPGSPVRPEDLRQSQYFDALETIREEEAEEADQPDNASVVSDQPACPGNDADTSADDWTDLSDVEEVEEPKQKQKRKKTFFDARKLFSAKVSTFLVSQKTNFQSV